MTQDKDKIEVVENEESETIALEPITGETGWFYLFFEMYSQNEIDYN